MSVRALAWVFEHSPIEERADFQVQLALAYHAHDDGDGAYPSVATLARETRLTRRGVQHALRRLEARRAIVRTGTRPGGAVIYRVAMDAPEGAQSVRRGEVTSRGEVSSQGGEATAPGGRTTRRTGGAATSPEPSLEPSEKNSPRAQARTRRALPTSSEDKLTDHIQGTLQRGIDGLTSDEPVKPPSRQAILTALRKHSPPHDLARAVAIEVRSIAQAQNRAPNIAGLYAQRLAKATEADR